MSPYMKRFVYMSLFYLGLAALIGMFAGMFNLGYAATFAHTHFNLLGFMAMIVFGIGYFILPRFNGADLRWPSWVPIHFWLGNLSLIGLVLFRGIYASSGNDLWNILFIIMATAQALSLFMFIINIWVTLSVTKQPVTAASTPVAAPPPELPVDSETRIADLIDQSPSIRDTLVQQGLRMLAVPGHIDKVRKVGVTLGMAAANHGLDESALIDAVKAELRRSPAASTASSGTSGALATSAGVNPSSGAANNINITTDTLIGDILKEHPQTDIIFQRYFGDGCIDCPGQSFESVDLACRMHGVDPALFMEELRAAARDQAAAK